MSTHQTRATLELYLLGAPQVVLNGKSLTDLPIKTQALLFYLAVTRQSQRRMTLATLLWGELPEQNARANLRKAVQQLRVVLPEHFHSDHLSATLHTDGSLWVDAVDFADQIVQAEKRNDFWTLEQAVQLYRDDFLAGFFVRNAPDFEAWQLAQRDRLREQMVWALETLAHHRAGQHKFPHAVAATRHLLTLEPWRETAHRQLMELLARSGQRDAALLQYERCRQALRTELDVDPAAETIALYEQIRADEFGAYTVDAPPAIPTSPRHALPTSTTPLLGRAAEIAQLVQLFANPSRRLVSIVAPGGMGKSHLAIAVATALVPHYADGVYFVALAPLTDAETMVPAIAAAVGYTFQNDGRAPAAQLLDYLRAKELLLLLDNAEHLLAGVPLFTAILEAAPNVCLLITSRERLRLNSETVFTLEGLAISAGDNQAQGAAVALFIQTAQRVRPVFVPTASDWPAIQQICQLVGGMPLGLILAASWVELLSPAEIAAEISRSLDFLAAELHDMPQRHHSLRAVFDTTWQRLPAEEQTVFQKLAVFQGGFTREAAECVAGASLATLTALKHIALIQTQPNGRYAIHELLRQFALETLGDQLADVRDKHSVYYCDFLAQREGDLKGPLQQAALAKIEADSENIRVAWRWSVETAQIEQLMQALSSLGLFYLWRSRLYEGKDMCRLAIEQFEKALAADQTAPVQPIQIRFAIRTFIWLSTFLRHLKQTRLAQDALQQARQWMSHPTVVDLDLLLEQAYLLQEEAEVIMFTDRKRAVQLAEQSLHLIRLLNDRWRAGQLLEFMGHALCVLGMVSRAREVTEDALALREELGDNRGLASSIHSLAQHAKFVGRFEEAEKLLHQSIALFAEVGDREQEAKVTQQLATSLVHSGKFAQSLQIFEKSMNLHSALELPGEPNILSIALGFALMHLGRYQEAQNHEQHALSIHGKFDHSYAYKDLGRLALVKGNYVEADENLQKALDLFRAKGDVNGYGQTLGCLALLALQSDNLQQARTYIRENVELAASTQVYLPSLTALAGVALLRAATADAAGAIELYTVALQHEHVANSQWYHDVVGRQIDAVAAKLPTDIVEAAQERGRSQDWSAVLQQLLAEWEGTFMHGTSDYPANSQER